MPSLFSPIRIRNLTLKNRIVMPPMVCFKWAGDDGLVTDRNVAHYEARARGGVGLVIVEAHAVNRLGRLASGQLGLWSDEHVPGLRRIAEACHRHGAAVLVQIHHAGLNTPRDICSPALAPSDIDDGKRLARAMTLEEIRATQQDFVAAARRAEAAGCDGVELHGAHRYLICQFASPITNRRTDGYGGDLARRTRFVREIVEGIRAAVRPDFVIGCRMGANEPALENGIAIAQELERAGVDLLHVSSGISEGDPPSAPEGFGYGWIAWMGTEVKKHVSVPVIAVNGIKTPQQAAGLVERGMADLVAAGRAMLVDPEWAAKAADGRPITPCRSCSPCRWFVDSRRCPAIRAMKKAATGPQ